MADVFPPDYSTPVGRVRKRIPDVRQYPDPKDPTSTPEYLFSDDELQSFIDDEPVDFEGNPYSWSIKRAAAWAMVAIANDENLTLRKITTEDLQTDGPAVARAMLQAAQVIFLQAATEEKNDVISEVFLEVPYTHTPPRYDWR